MMNRVTGGNASTEERRQLAYRVAIALLLLVGIWFRSRRFFVDPLGLWLDEATWGGRLFTRSAWDLEFRPIGYMAVTKLLVSLHCDERTLRSLSWLSGVATLPVTLVIARRMFASRTVRVLCLATVALHPLLIDMSREFKPYALELFVHLGLIALFVRWHGQRSRARLATLLVCAALAFPFAYNVVFLLPALFTLLGLTLLRGRSFRAIAACVAGALVTLAIIGAIYVKALRSTAASDTDGAEQFWGDKYHVFFRSPDANPPLSARALWLGGKYVGLSAFPNGFGIAPVGNELTSEAFEDKVAVVSTYAWLGLHLLGLFALIRRRRVELVLLTGPLLVTILFNRLGLWPFGMFRTNVFLLAYVVLIPMFGLQFLLGCRKKLAWAGAAFGYALVAASFLTVGRDFHQRKHFFATQTEVASLLERARDLHGRLAPEQLAEKTVLLLDSYACSPFMFLVERQPAARRPFEDLLTNQLDPRCGKHFPNVRAALQEPGARPILVVSTDERARRSLIEICRTHGRIIASEDVRGSHELYLVKPRARSR